MPEELWSQHKKKSKIAWFGVGKIVWKVSDPDNFGRKQKKFAWQKSLLKLKIDKIVF